MAEPQQLTAAGVSGPSQASGRSNNNNNIRIADTDTACVRDFGKDVRPLSPAGLQRLCLGSYRGDKVTKQTVLVQSAERFLQQEPLFVLKERAYSRMRFWGMSHMDGGCSVACMDKGKVLSWNESAHCESVMIKQPGTTRCFAATPIRIQAGCSRRTHVYCESCQDCQ
eukprot:358859-Chlamydomonas_euryale.AAC.21